MTRQRPVLRIVAELAILNAWPEGVSKGASEVMKVIKGFVSAFLDVGSGRADGSDGQ